MMGKASEKTLVPRYLVYYLVQTGRAAKLQQVDFPVRVCERGATDGQCDQFFQNFPLFS
jgi:hypothetical protein